MTNPTQSILGVSEAIKQRRAARSFKPDMIPENTLKEIFTLGVRSPSGYNLQPWRFIVLRDQASKDKLKACAFGQQQVGEAPVVLICCGDRKVSNPSYVESVVELGQKHNAMPDQYANVLRENIPTFFSNKPSFEALEAWTNRHTMLAVAHLMIAAKSLGVDSCPMEGFMANEVKDAFNIPATVDVCCLLCLGYADAPIKSFGGRFPIEDVYFSESFGNEFH